MIAYLARIFFAPFKPLFDWSDRRYDEMTTEALADAQQCPDLIEPPEAVLHAQELTTEVVLDLANERWFEHGAEDVAAWEREVRSDA